MSDSSTRLSFSERLKVTIDAFLIRVRMSPTEFGQRILNDTSLYTRIKRGRPINTNTIDAIEALIRGWPKGKTAAENPQVRHSYFEAEPPQKKRK